jgi:HD-like signal output (HDOD) protein
MALRVSEQRMLARLDATLASDSTRNALVPRAAAVIPQLLNSLRDESQSSLVLATKIAKDPLLVAEVIRLANSAHNSLRGGDGAPSTDLPQAVTRIGIEGLRRAIARVVLKPIFDAQADPLSARTAPRLWLHSEAQSAECMRLCRVAGIDPFEGYLAGLMHNIGWTAALRVIGRSEASIPKHFSHAFVRAFESTCDRFFAMLVMPWELTESITALAKEILDGGLEASRSPLGQALGAAERHASLQLISMQPNSLQPNSLQTVGASVTTVAPAQSPSTRVDSPAAHVAPVLAARAASGATTTYPGRPGIRI